MCKTLIKNGTVYDGCGNKLNCDVAIKDDIITGIGKFENNYFDNIIDAKGLTVFPGFIDCHTHSDVALLKKPDRKEAIMQGITTEIISSCGIGVLPFLKDYAKTVKAIFGEHDFNKSFTNYDEYISAVGKSGTNFLYQAAHSPIRYACLGANDVEINDENIEKMEFCLENEFKNGACAFSTGLSYYPASFSNTYELVKLCKVAKKYDSPFTIHLRSVINSHFDKETFNAVGEAIKIAELTGVHLHFSHRRTTFSDFKDINTVIDVIESGISSGLEITADFYPYPVGCGYVAVFLPLWVMNGTYDEIIDVLSSKENRKRISKEMSEINANPDGVFTDAPNHPEFLGKTFAEAALMCGKSVCDMLVDFLFKENLCGGYRLSAKFSKAEISDFENSCACLLKKPYYSVGSDTLPFHSYIHPRSYGTFPKILRIAREHNIPFETISQRLCSDPARIFKINKRGMIKEGYFADICIFDEKTVSEKATFESPKNFSDGIKYVFVNGVKTVENGKFLNKMSGRGLKRSM